MIQCNNCRNMVPDGASFCPICGAPLTAPVPACPPQFAGGVRVFSPMPTPVIVIGGGGKQAVPPRAGAPKARGSAPKAKARPVNGRPEHGLPAMLKLTGITKDYKAASGTVHALRGVSLEFRKSEFVCVLGQSGCGKTTLLNIIGGLDHYTSGDLVIQGRSTKKYRDRDWDVYRNHRIGFIFQTYNLIPHQTVLENVELALTIAGVGKAERRQRAKEALERVGLGSELKKKPNQLSGGQMQRVAIARALVNNPDILLADEPTGALDSKTSVEVMELIKEIAKERLVIMVTHNGDLAEEYASRIVRLKDGEVESDSNPYIGDMVPPEEVREKKKKGEPRAKMGIFTSLALSFRNLLTKRGRTLITSFAGSIGIISVCLVLALSSGFNNYIRHTEEDMLSSSPIEVSETALDVTAVMEGIRSPADMPTLEELHDEVYINSFLTGLAQGVAVTNDISEEYINYLEKGKADHPDWFSALHYGYGINLENNLFMPLVTGGYVLGGEMVEAKTQNFSLSRLKSYLIDELVRYAPEYTRLLPYVTLFTDIVNVMPGTKDFTDPEYSKYVLSQYDLVDGKFPTNENETVLVVGEQNELIDLTLVQLGFLTEDRFLDLFNAGVPAAEEGELPAPVAITIAEEGDEEEDKALTRISYERIYAQDYMLYSNDVVYPENEGYGGYVDSARGQYPFGSVNEVEELSKEDGIPLKISGILRLKPNFTYGCLDEGLNLTEATVLSYLKMNMGTKIVEWATSDAAKLPATLTGGLAETDLYLSPSAALNSYYTEYTTSMLGMNITLYITYAPSAAVRSLGGDDAPNDVLIYPVDFDAKDDVLGYLDGWNDSHEESLQITYTDRVGLMMGMVQTMLDVITYVLVAFTAISLVVSSVMIGIITYVSVVERIKEIGVLRSLGARKQDIRNLFNAETFIIGLAAGLIGIVVTYGIAVIVSMIIESLSGIAGIATLPPLTAFIMVCVSVVLTLISGLIPAQAAAKKDPVIALRTE